MQATSLNIQKYHNFPLLLSYLLLNVSMVANLLIISCFPWTTSNKKCGSSFFLMESINHL